MYADALEKGEVQTAVCPSHYMGLVEMYRTTGEKRYLKLAEQAIALRDSVKEGMDDNRDRIRCGSMRRLLDMQYVQIIFMQEWQIFVWKKMMRN